MSYADFPLGVECAWPSSMVTLPAAKVSRRGTPLARLLFLAALLFGGWHLGHAAYIAGKAELAQVLIGHVFGTANPGEPGNGVIGGNHDTHLNFLKSVRVGERFTIERPDGQRVGYCVARPARGD